MPDAAPVITATRPHSKARCLAASKGEKICANTRPRARTRMRNGVRAADRATRERWGRLCWAPAAPSRPPCRCARIGVAKRDGSGTLVVTCKTRRRKMSRREDGDRERGQERRLCLPIDVILHHFYTLATVPIIPRPASSMSPASLPLVLERLRRTSG